MKRTSILTLLILLHASIAFALPSIDSTSGTLSNGNTVTVSGTGFESIPSGDIAGDHFDDVTSSVTYYVDDQAVEGAGNLTIFSELNLDTDVITSGGSMYQGEHLGYWFVLRENASNYTSGYGFRRITFAAEDPIEDPINKSSGDNYGADYVFSGVTEIWISFLFRTNAAGLDSNVDYPENPDGICSPEYNCTAYQWGKFFRIWRPNAGWLYFHRHNYWWYNTGCCKGDVNRYYIYIGHSADEDGNGAPFPSAQTPCPDGLTCDDIAGAPNGKWQHILAHMKLDDPYDADNGVLEYWINGTLISSQDDLNLITAEGDTITIVQFFSNHSQGRCWLEPNAEKQSSFDIDDIVLSSVTPTLPPRVYISNQADWQSGPNDKWNGDANTWIRQKVGGTTPGTDLGYLSWASGGTEFKFEYQDGGLSGSKYLYVWNSDEEHNVTGYLLGEDPAMVAEHKKATYSAQGAKVLYSAQGAKIISP